MYYKTKGLKQNSLKSMYYKTKELKQNSLSQCLTKPKGSNKIV